MWFRNLLRHDVKIQNNLNQHKQYQNMKYAFCSEIKKKLVSQFYKKHIKY